MTGRHRAPRRGGRRSGLVGVLAGALALGVWSGPPAQAWAAHPGASFTNLALVENHRDDGYRHRLAFSVRETYGRGATATNVAVAVASCQGCQTVAVAFQVVVVGGRFHGPWSHGHGFRDPGLRDPDASLPGDVVAVNRSVAVNDQCVRCHTIALAYQFVVVDSDPVRLTHQGRRELRDLRRQLADLMVSPPGDEEVFAAQVATLAGLVQQVLADEVQERPSRLLKRYTRADSDERDETHHGGDLGHGPEDVTGDAPQPTRGMAA